MTGMLRYPYPFHHFSSSGGVSPFPRTPLPTNGIRPGSVRPESHPGRHVTDINKATDKKQVLKWKCWGRCLVPLCPVDRSNV